MSIFVVTIAKTTLVLTAVFTLASGAYASTISSFSVSTVAADGTPCSMSGSGPGTASCHSQSAVGSSFFASGDANATVTDNSLQLNVFGLHEGGGIAFASITHDDFYSVPVNGPVSALETLTCLNSTGNQPDAIGHFSLGSTSVSPPVESIYTGASQGSGPCGDRYQIASGVNAFVVSLVAMNNIVELRTFIDGNVQPGDDINADIFVQLTVNGFLDANGNPITATLLPEPGTLGTFALAVLLGAGVRGKRKLFGLGHTLLS